MKAHALLQDIHRQPDEGRAVNWDDYTDAAETDTGLRRQNNQDSYTIVRAPNAESWRSRGHLFVVADGMGAHAVGELASKKACDRIPHIYGKAMQIKGKSPGEALRKAFEQAASQIHHIAEVNQDFKGTGTTCSALLLLPEGGLIAHVGDSRVYRVREGQIDQLTSDHSLLWELVQRNHMSLEQAQQVVPQNVITRSLGPEPSVEVDIEGPFEVLPGDRFLLCSDGLSGPVSDEEIGAFLGNLPPADAVRYLVHLANLRGGNDNITVVIAQAGGDRVEPASNGRHGRKAKTSSGGGGSRLSGLMGLFGKPTRKLEIEEAHAYMSCPCPVEMPLIHRLIEQIRLTQDRAVDEQWQLDWSQLTNLRQEADKARDEENLVTTLQALGESINLLGYAWRSHEKTRKQQARGVV